MASELTGLALAGKLAGLHATLPNSLATLEPKPRLEAVGIRFGPRGTHTSRTMMVAELGEVLAAVPAGGTREDYRSAIIDDNCLGKDTVSTRRLSNQRLSELYGLDPALPVFRVLRRVWDLDAAGRPLVALLVALARDPMLRASAPAVLGLPIGAELVRTAFLEQLAGALGDRLNPATLDKVARNAGSTWTQSGHLAGRVRKVRRRAEASPGPVALALWLGHLGGLAGEDLLRSPWASVLDCTPARLRELVLEAKRLGLIDARMGADVVEIDPRRLDPLGGGR